MRNHTQPQGCCVPSWFSLHCRVLTSSQASSDQREKLSSAPLSFNIPNTSAWNNRSSTSQCLLLACCLVCLSYLLPWNLPSPALLSLHPRTLLLNCYLLHGENGTVWCPPKRELRINISPLILKHRNSYLSSSTSQRCLSTAMATIWGWEKTGPRSVMWNCQPGPRNPKTSSGSTGW